MAACAPAADTIDDGEHGVVSALQGRGGRGAESPLGRRTVLARVLASYSPNRRKHARAAGLSAGVHTNALRASSFFVRMRHRAHEVGATSLTTLPTLHLAVATISRWRTRAKPL